MGPQRKKKKDPQEKKKQMHAGVGNVKKGKRKKEKMGKRHERLCKRWEKREGEDGARKKKL